MSRKLDNLSLIFSAVGFLLFFLYLIVYAYYIEQPILLVLTFLLSFFGLILGVIALIEKPEYKWKPILAIYLFILVVVLISIWSNGIVNQHAVGCGANTVLNSSKPVCL